MARHVLLASCGARRDRGPFVVMAAGAETCKFVNAGPRDSMAREPFGVAQIVDAGLGPLSDLDLPCARIGGMSGLPAEYLLGDEGPGRHR